MDASEQIVQRVFSSVDPPPPPLCKLQEPREKKGNIMIMDSVATPFRSLIDCQIEGRIVEQLSMLCSES